MRPDPARKLAEVELIFSMGCAAKAITAPNHFRV